MKLSGHISATLAVALFLWQATRSGGWLEATAGQYAHFFWLAFLGWTVSSVVAVCQKQHWWVVATAPFALYPAAMFGLLLAACAQGNCI